MRLPARHCATPACSDSSVAVSRFCDLLADVLHGERARGVGDPAVERDADVDRDDVAALQPVGAGDAVHDHRVRRGADRAGEAAVALERRRGALRADEALGELVELGGAHAGADLASRSDRASPRGSRPRAPSSRSPAGDFLMITQRSLARSAGSVAGGRVTELELLLQAQRGDGGPDVRVHLVGAAPCRRSGAAARRGRSRRSAARSGSGRPPGAGGSPPRGRRRAGSGARRPGRRRPRAWAGRSRRGRCGWGSSRTPAARPGGARDRRRAPRSAARAVRLPVEAVAAPRRARRPAPRCAGSRRAGSRRARRRRRAAG